MKDIASSLGILKVTRDNFLKLISPLTSKELNHIPEKFNNNIAWNFGHIVATHQLLIYGLSGTEMYMENDLINKYRKGTKPTDIIDENEIKILKSLAIKTIDALQSDYEKQVFGNYKIYTTSYGITLNSVEEAIQFNNSHEALHLGTCIDLLKFI